MLIGFGGSTDELNEGLARLKLAMEECASTDNMTSMLPAKIS